MYTIAGTFEESKNEAIAVSDTYAFFGDTLERCAFVWQEYAEKHGVDFIVNVVRYFENGKWIDTWYPFDRDAAERLAQSWIEGTNDVKGRLFESLN